MLGGISDAELVDHYARCRAVYFAPWNEDYGFVTLEAFRSGKAVDHHHRQRRAGGAGAPRRERAGRTGHAGGGGRPPRRAGRRSRPRREARPGRAPRCDPAHLGPRGRGAHPPAVARPRGRSRKCEFGANCVAIVVHEEGTGGEGGRGAPPGARRRLHHRLRPAHRAALSAGGRGRHRLRPGPRRSRPVPVHARHPRDDVPRQDLDDAPVRRASAPRPRPTSGSSTCSSTARTASRSPSTCRR